MAGVSHEPAPDGGWGWFIVLSSFLLQALTIGITYTFGVIFVKFMDVFGADEATTSWIGSIQPCLLYLTGIITGPLIKRFGWRIVTICGSVLSAIGFFTSSFAPNVYLLYFTYGALTGIGNGLMYVTSMVAVQHWFDRKRAMATGLAVSGSGVGTLVFGFLTQYLLDSFDWQWTLRIEALIMLLGVICGILFRPLPKSEDISDDSMHLTDSQKQENDIKNGRRWQEEEEDQNKGCCGDCGSLLKETFDFSLFKRPVFALYCFVIVMFCFGYHVPYTYTPERAQGLGVDPQSASFLVSIMGIANVCARLIFGWLGDRSPNIRFYLAGIVLTCGGVVSILVFLFTTYPLMVLYAILFGAFTGCWASLFPVILVDLLGIEVIEKSLGQCLAAGSIAFLVASPMSGLIIQKTGDINVPYYVVGAAETFGGLVYFFIKCIHKKPEYEPIPEEQPMKRRRYVSESFS